METNWSWADWAQLLIYASIIEIALSRSGWKVIESVKESEIFCLGPKLKLNFDI